MEQGQEKFMIMIRNILMKERSSTINKKAMESHRLMKSTSIKVIIVNADSMDTESFTILMANAFSEYLKTI